MPKRILVVDDETDFSEMLEFRLRQLGYDVFVAASGTEALNKARRRSPDVILLDLLLPDLDGVTICEILRLQPSTCDTPVFLISALTNEVIPEAARNAGANGFLGKPLNFEELKRRLQTVLAPSPSGFSADEPMASAPSASARRTSALPSQAQRMALPSRAQSEP